MDYKNVKFTRQLAKAIELADQERIKTKSSCLLPAHLLIGCLDDGSTPVKEAKEKTGIDIVSLKNSIIRAENSTPGILFKPFKSPVSTETKQVLQVSINYMNSYNQIYLNLGHVIKALITTGLTEGLLSQEQSHALLSLAAVSRDMLVNLSDYTAPEISYRNIRKVTNLDADGLMRFIEEEFSGRWNESIKNAFSQLHPPIIIAKDSSGKIVGFAVYNTNGHFGPMGTALNRRSEGIGVSLLHCCLNEMKLKGKRKVIIDQAGPIEFYETACNAQVIPVR
ncbi:hypothetical protein [Mesobacillus subterraneus]|uniref:GNAT family N-acetyltransferase n=1 Tax=Mesobacillus subterraneus TaxID=285983 RepID=A0A3R9E704_9BACI|nr:hypothetical protein [Mesobacillus subterraneus]RSD25431.1 hypothetical protein EJA10_16615 [Mesobacillus subterraneus]